MDSVRKCITTSAVLAVMSVLCQTTSFAIPGWFITETMDVSLNMALWYVIVCGREHNITNGSVSCEVVSYKHLFAEQPDDIVSLLGMYLLTSILSYYIRFIVDVFVHSVISVCIFGDPIG